VTNKDLWNYNLKKKSLVFGHLTKLSKDEINKWKRDRRGRDRMVVGFTTTYAIGAYHH
jgi:hypothetical protein